MEDDVAEPSNISHCQQLLTFTPQKLRSALWFQVGKIVDEESINLGVNATPQFIGSLMELVWAQIGNHTSNSAHDVVC